MRLEDLYRTIIEIGEEADPRGRAGVRRELARLKRDYADFSPARREQFDAERLSNPYADTRILAGDPGLEVKSVMVGIDIEVGEVVLADRLRERGRRIDLLLAHHPEGKALAGFYHVMNMQADILHRFGVPINVAEALMEERITEVERKSMPTNFARAVDAAALLGLPFLCAHTPADNCVAGYLEERFRKRKPLIVGDVLALLGEIPEYREAARYNAPPRPVAGKETNRTGTIAVDMTGGAEGPKEALSKLVQAGVGTMVCMHMSVEYIQKAKEHNLNVVIAGHVASDNLGLNLLLDRVCAREALGIIPCSGFRRVSRPAVRKRPLSPGPEGRGGGTASR